MSTYKIYRESDYRKDAIDLLKDLSIKYDCTMYLDGCMEGIPVKVICIGDYSTEVEIQCKEVFMEYLVNVLGEIVRGGDFPFSIDFRHKFSLMFKLCIVLGECVEASCLKESDYREDVIQFLKSLSSEYNCKIYAVENFDGIPLNVYCDATVDLETNIEMSRKYLDFLYDIFGEILLCGEPPFNNDINSCTPVYYHLLFEKGNCYEHIFETTN